MGRWYVTGYNNVRSQTDGDPDITASGRRIVMATTIAIDPTYWPRAISEKWWFYIEGIGLVRADDTGLKVTGRYRADVAVSSPHAARAITGMRDVWFVGPRDWRD